MTLAKHLRALKPDWSWGDCRAAIHAGRVTVDGTRIDDDTFRPPSDAMITIHDQPQKPSTQKAQEPGIHFYYLDDHIVVVEKHSGIESVPFSTKKNLDDRHAHAARDTLIDLTRKQIERREKRRIPPLKVVHRLDKGTSGILVFARSALAERSLGQQFRTHSITRRYVAFCHGICPSQVIQSRLVEDRGDGKRGSTNNPSLGKEALTHVITVETKHPDRGGPISLVRCSLETGRTHQIRIHLSEAGFPLCGERVYLGPRGSRVVNHDACKIPRIGLHAEELGFIHPATSQPLHWTSPLPQDLALWWASL